MRISGIITCLLLFSTLSFAQNPLNIPADGRKGEFYFYWGWNWSWYSQSDIHFQGAGYDFTLDNIVAKDRQSPFNFETYFHPSKFSIPQYNFRLGFFISDNYSISIGTDHMKYVAQAYQTTKISGQIAGTGTLYDGVYDQEKIILSEDFVSFEHTDGLNYINADVRRSEKVYAIKNITIDLAGGLGMGVLFPKTNARLWNKDRHDAFHVSGYGLSGLVGLSATFFRFLFIQSELKAGYINMPDIKTTSSDLDKASQDFFFTQFNIALGARWNLN